MSEEILKALTQLFAIISKQDGGVTEAERDYVITFFKQELDRETVAEYLVLYDKDAEYTGLKDAVDESEEEDGKGEKKKKKLINVKDSVKSLAICRKFNKTLTQKQKVIVLVRLLEMLAADRHFTPQRMEIINTVSTVFNIPKNEYELLEKFAIEQHSSKFDTEDILIFDDNKPEGETKVRFIDSGLLDGEIIFARVRSVDLYFTKYTGQDMIFLNGQIVKTNSMLLFSHGSVIKTPKGLPLYYSDLVSRYNSDNTQDNISFNVYDLEFKFPNGAVGLRNVDISEGTGKLISIMGASGAGKTTLLNVLAGLETPSSGKVTINGFNIHTESDKIEGLIGYIAQDDLLIEELTVFQNLYYNAKLCFRDLEDDEISKKVDVVLESLGLDRIKHLKVGNVLNKKISGGQRKRLNIALELIREPAVMFVDEPTSGLSSRDSENVIDLLKELSLKGKLIFVVIHQPSSDIYKMFDKVFLLDTGGYPIYYGNPVEAIIYFKKATNQVGGDKGQCMTCGNVTPEQLFNIVEARVVDEYGEFTNKRKASPNDWFSLHKESFKVERVEESKDSPPKNLKIPSKLKQMLIFSTRDFLSKISNTQYMLINLLEAPVLAFMLAFIIRYKEGYDTEYVFRHNDNMPAYILMAVIVALFMGLTVSAEEIIRDRKILRRESFLNLSRMSYIVSKVLILFSLSAIQTLCFSVLGNWIVGVEGLTMSYWAILFTVSCFANILGLNISSAFNSAVTVYILIPLLIIPQLILSGAIFNFDKLNSFISQQGKVPVIADLIASRWAYEGLIVQQFRNNSYQRPLFEKEAIASQNHFRSVYWIPKIEELLINAKTLMGDSSDSSKIKMEYYLAVIKHEIMLDPYYNDTTQSSETEILDSKGGANTITAEDTSSMTLDVSSGGDSDSSALANVKGNESGAEDGKTTKDSSLVVNEQNSDSSAGTSVAEVVTESNSDITSGPRKLLEADFDPKKFNEEKYRSIKLWLEAATEYYNLKFTAANSEKEELLYVIQEKIKKHSTLTEFQNKYYNDAISDVVKDASAEERVMLHEDRIIQIMDPVFNLGPPAASVFDYRTHFYAGKKHLFGKSFNTFYFNLCVIWGMSLFLFVALYYDALKHLIDALSKINIPLPNFKKLFKKEKEASEAVGQKGDDKKTTVKKEASQKQNEAAKDLPV